MKKIAVLGSTGSIGTQTLDVISRMPERFEVVGLAAGQNVDLLLEQARTFRPRWISAQTQELADKLRRDVPAGVTVLYGEEGLRHIAAHAGAEFVVCALVGSMGLTSTLAAIEAGADIGLANKETLVAAGSLVMRRAKEKGVSILPVDSEHSALFQCLNGERPQDVARLILTASGGSFRDRTREELRGVTVDQALKHPNWSMGAKVTIDSATMANKGLEVIEARWLFDVDFDRIDVVIHPESIIHSMVEFTDTSVIAQLGNPDMRVPIQYALTFPERCPSPASPLDLLARGSLNFRVMDFARYPCLKYAYEAGKAGGTSPAVFNAANEIAVARFLRGEIAFLDIDDIVCRTLESHETVAEPALEQILEADGWARRLAAGTQ